MRAWNPQGQWLLESWAACDGRVWMVNRHHEQAEQTRTLTKETQRQGQPSLGVVARAECEGEVPGSVHALGYALHSFPKNPDGQPCSDPGLSRRPVPGFRPPERARMRKWRDEPRNTWSCTGAFSRWLGEHTKQGPGASPSCSLVLLPAVLSPLKAQATV